jgi:hypothetical protein
MGTYLWTQVKFGGRINASLLDPEHDDYVGDDIAEEIEAAAAAKTFGTIEDETSYGNAEDLTSRLADAGLTYRRTCDGLEGDFNGKIEWYSPGTEPDPPEADCDADGFALLTLPQLEEAADAGKTLADLIASLAWTKRDPPPIEIVDDAGAHGEPETTAEPPDA